jgi:hypothetical protein
LRCSSRRSDACARASSRSSRLTASSQDIGTRCTLRYDQVNSRGRFPTVLSSTLAHRSDARQPSVAGVAGQVTSRLVEQRRNAAQLGREPGLPTRVQRKRVCPQFDHRVVGGFLVSGRVALRRVDGPIERRIARPRLRGCRNRDRSFRPSPAGSRLAGGPARLWDRSPADAPAATRARDAAAKRAPPTNPHRRSRLRHGARIIGERPCASGQPCSRAALRVPTARRVLTSFHRKRA